MMPPKEHAPDPEFHEAGFSFVFYTVYFGILIYWILRIFMEST